MLQSQMPETPFRVDYQEKRNYLRMQLETEVGFAAPGARAMSCGKTKNLSSEGILFETDQPVKAGDTFNIEVKPATGNYSPLRATAAVVRVDVSGGGKLMVACQLAEVR